VPETPTENAVCYFEYEKYKLFVVRLEVLTAVLLNTEVSYSSVAKHWRFSQQCC
jgi:hypothetical protein